jgi:hypothetical protein
MVIKIKAILTCENYACEGPLGLGGRSSEEVELEVTIGERGKLKTDTSELPRGWYSEGDYSGGSSLLCEACDRNKHPWRHR